MQMKNEKDEVINYIMCTWVRSLVLNSGLGSGRLMQILKYINSIKKKREKKIVLFLSADFYR